MSQRKYTNVIERLEGKRSKELMSSTSLSGMSQLSNSSEEALEALVHKSHKSDNSENTTNARNTLNNKWLLNGPNGSKTSVLRFKCSALATPPEDPPAKQLHMTYKIFQTDTRLINLLLQSHGLIEVPMNETDFNVLWMGSHPKPDILRSLMPYQKINHFPRSYEITRKDRLYKNIEAMQRSKGLRNLDFIPQTFLLPTEARELISAHFRYRGPWIVKPKASSRGRGIYIVNNPEKILTDESVIVAQYINNPLLVDGHKCDLRLYVAVTNYDPLLIYLYEEGLVRFAAVKYDGRSQYIWNPCMHLCNYSINKFHVDYIKSEDPDAEDVGHKWTLSALLRHLRSMGQDTESLMQRIEDIIIKSILATASGIVSGLKQFVKHPETCFELFGFDILIDETLKPWLIEVNLTPSLGCDSPLDVRLKSALIADLFTLVGVAAVDPILRSQNLNRAAINSNKKITSYRRVQSAETLPQGKKNTNRNNKSKAGLSSEQQRIVASAKAQFERRGGFVRIFPSPKSWELYSQYLDPITGAPMISDPLGPRRLPQNINTNHNLMLHEQLFPAANRVTGYIIPEVTLDRLSRYERYERALVKGHKQSLDRGNNKENLDVDMHKYKNQVIQSMQEGNKLSSGEARKAFGLYLGYILRKISQPNADPGCCDLVMKFLQHSSCSLRTPFLFTLPCSKLSDKDRAAITAKQLSDFLHLYNRETDLYEDTVDRPRTVPNKLFQKFLAAASEQDLDDVLILQTRLYKCAHSFLGRSGFAGNLRGANLLGSLPHITSRVYSNAAATEQCRCNNLINRKCHLVSLYFSFFYLLVIFRLGDYFGLPSPPTHTNLVVMILTLKLPGLAFEINSAATAPADDDQGANSDALKKINFMDVIHYSFGYMGVLTGPYYRYRTYWDSLHRPFSSYVDPWPLTYYKLKQIAAFIVMYLAINHLFSANYTQTAAFEEHCFLYRFFYMYPTFASFRLRMFIGMALAECVCQMSGLGAYPVCCQPTPGLGPRDYTTIEKLSLDRERVKKEEQDFETVHNMNVWEVELTPFVRHTMKMWNTCIQYWMAVYIYKRFPYKGLRTVATLTLSALWHGYAAGYYFCICQVPFYLPFENICVKFYNQCEENGLGRKAWGLFLWWAKLTCMAYLGVPFQLLRFQEIIHFYKSLYFSGHILGLMAYLVVRVLKTHFLKKHQMEEQKKK